MLFNLNEFLMSVSFALDFVEMDVLGVKSNHGKRTAYIALKVAEELGLNSEQIHDVVALAILHDNGVSEKSLHDKFILEENISVNSLERAIEHCTIGEDNVIQYPFLTDVKDVIKYHHERYDGEGFFGLRGEETPLISQIIYVADRVEVNFDLENSDLDTQKKVLDFVNDQKNAMFSERIVEALEKAARGQDFWINLKDEYIVKALRSNMPKYSMDLSFENIRKITGVLSKIIDAKSKYTQKHSSDLSQKVSVMADFYNMRLDEKMKLVIASDLHDIGKLAVPNSILDSPNKLSEMEFEVIKKHSYYTRIALQELKGFEDITEWSSNHHEKLNGAGYPFGKSGKDLDFNSRIIACLDIYEALTEDRPYRKALHHKEAMEILNNMVDEGLIDSKITEDIDKAFNR